MIARNSSKFLSGIAMIMFLVAPYTAGTGHIAIPAAAFQPLNNAVAYSNYGSGISTGGAYWWYPFHAPLQLPDHAVITGMTYYWSDYSPDADTYVDFVESNLDGTTNVVSTAYSNGGTGIASSSTVTMTLTVDNSIHAYYLDMSFASGDAYSGYGVVIDYTYPVLLPLIRR